MSTEICEDHLTRIKSLEGNMHSLEIKLTKIESTTEHIKCRIDNGLSSTVTKIYDQLSQLVPKVADNTEVVGKVKLGTFWVVVTGLIGGLFSFMWHMFMGMLNKG